MATTAEQLAAIRDALAALTARVDDLEAAIGAEKDARLADRAVARKAINDLQDKVATLHDQGAQVVKKLKRVRQQSRSAQVTAEQPERQTKGTSPLLADRTIRVRVGNRTVVRAARPR